MERSDEMASAEKQAAVFAALADPTRLKLVKLLCRQRDPDALCVNALAMMLEVSQSAVSQHLRVLRAIGLVEAKRRGYRVHYFINWETLEQCRDIVTAALSAGNRGENEMEGKDPCPLRKAQEGQ